MVDERVVVGGDELVAPAPGRRSSVVATSQPSGRPAQRQRVRLALAPSTRRQTPVPLKKPRDASRKAARTEVSKA